MDRLSCTYSISQLMFSYLRLFMVVSVFHRSYMQVTYKLYVSVDIDMYLSVLVYFAVICRCIHYCFGSAGTKRKSGQGLSTSTNFFADL